MTKPKSTSKAGTIFFYNTTDYLTAVKIKLRMGGVEFWRKEKDINGVVKTHHSFYPYHRVSSISYET